jgi:hypothetical protein
VYLFGGTADTYCMNRTLKLLGIVGVVTAAGMAAIKRALPGPSIEPYAVHPLPTVSHELRQALHRFEERFGA